MTLTDDRCESELTIERRGEVRRGIDLDVRLFEPYAGRFVAARTVNVSAGGVCLSLSAETELRAGRIITLHGLAVGPRLGGSPTRPLTARVVWVAEDPESTENILVGLQLYAAALAAAA